MAEAVVAERIRLAAELLAAFLVWIGQISDLAIFTDQLRASDGETNEFTHRSREKLLYERGPEAIQRLNGSLAAAHAAFSREARVPAFELLVFLQRAIEDGPLSMLTKPAPAPRAAANALGSEVRVEEAVSYQKKLSR